MEPVIPDDAHTFAGTKPDPLGPDRPVDHRPSLSASGYNAQIVELCCSCRGPWNAIATWDLSELGQDWTVRISLVMEAWRAHLAEARPYTPCEFEGDTCQIHGAKHSGLDLRCVGGLFEALTADAQGEAAAVIARLYVTGGRA